MDKEQIKLGNSEEFWKLIAQRRVQKTISRAELEQRLGTGIEPKDNIEGNVYKNA